MSSCALKDVSSLPIHSQATCAVCAMRYSKTAFYSVSQLRCLLAPQKVCRGFVTILFFVPLFFTQRLAISKTAGGSRKVLLQPKASSCFGFERCRGPTWSTAILPFSSRASCRRGCWRSVRRFTHFKAVCRSLVLFDGLSVFNVSNDLTWPIRSITTDRAFTLDFSSCSCAVLMKAVEEKTRSRRV